MRVISGEWRGRNLKAPKGESTRPTSDRTRETLFNMLASRIGDFEGLKVADLFAGSGALGIEALSRGAAHCLFVEQDQTAAKTIRDNLSQFNVGSRAEVRASSVMSLAATHEPYDLLLLDPPYSTGAGAVALDRLLRLGWIGDGTWIALETSVGEDAQIKGLDILAQRKVGKAMLHLLQRIA